MTGLLMFYPWRVLIEQRHTRTGDYCIIECLLSACCLTSVLSDSHSHRYAHVMTQLFSGNVVSTWIFNRRKKEKRKYLESKMSEGDGENNVGCWLAFSCPTWPYAKLQMNTTLCVNILSAVYYCHWIRARNRTLLKTNIKRSSHGGGQWQEEDLGECGNREPVWQDLGLHNRVEHWQHRLRGQEGQIQTLHCGQGPTEVNPRMMSIAMFMFNV